MAVESKAIQNFPPNLHTQNIPCPNYEIEEASDWNASWQLLLNCLEDFEFHDASHPTTDSVSLSEQDR